MAGSPLESYRSLEAAAGRARVLLSSRVDVQRFHSYATTGLGHRLVGTAVYLPSE